MVTNFRLVCLDNIKYNIVVLYVHVICAVSEHTVNIFIHHIIYSMMRARINCRVVIKTAVICGGRTLPLFIFTTHPAVVDKYTTYISTMIITTNYVYYDVKHQ